MSHLKELLASCVDPDKCEATAYPYWIIIDPKYVGLCSMDQRVHCVAHAITGPFFSREAAVEHMDQARHHFSKHAKVYCASGHTSWQWQHLLRMGKHEPQRTEVEEMTRDAAPDLLAALKDFVTSTHGTGVVREAAIAAKTKAGCWDFGVTAFDPATGCRPNSEMNEDGSAKEVQS